MVVSTCRSRIRVPAWHGHGQKAVDACLVGAHAIQATAAARDGHAAVPERLCSDTEICSAILQGICWNHLPAGMDACLQAAACMLDLLWRTACGAKVCTRHATSMQACLTLQRTGDCCSRMSTQQSRAAVPSTAAPLHTLPCLPAATRRSGLVVQLLRKARACALLGAVQDPAGARQLCLCGDGAAGAAYGP